MEISNWLSLLLLISSFIIIAIFRRKKFHDKERHRQEAIKEIQKFGFSPMRSALMFYGLVCIMLLILFFILYIGTYILLAIKQ